MDIQELESNIAKLLDQGWNPRAAVADSPSLDLFNHWLNQYVDGLIATKVENLPIQPPTEPRQNGKSKPDQSDL